VIAIIQARMGSTRLPGKVLMKIKEKPALEHIIDFLKLTKEVDEIIIATTKLEEDDEIAEIAKKLDICCFRGSEKDVLKRYYDCAKKFKGSIIVRYCADNLLVNPKLIDEAVRISKESNFEYVSSVLEESYPYGYSSCEVLSFTALKKLHETQKNSLSREHVTYDIRQNPKNYRVKSMLVSKELSREKWKLALDDINDFKRLKQIFDRLYSKNDFIDYKKMVEFLDKNYEQKMPNKK